MFRPTTHLLYGTVDFAVFRPLQLSTGIALGRTNNDGLVSSKSKIKRQYRKINNVIIDGRIGVQFNLRIAYTSIVPTVHYSSVGLPVAETDDDHARR